MTSEEIKVILVEYIKTIDKSKNQGIIYIDGFYNRQNNLIEINFKESIYRIK